MKIAIIGAGVYGTALGGVLVERGYEVDYYDPFVYDKTLAEVLDGAEMVLLVAPSGAVPELVPELPSDLPLIVATKGLLTGRVFEGFTDVMVLSGPGFADDIKAHKLTYLTVTDKRLEEMFGVDYLQFDETADKLGVLMCGALKNVYAILAGYLDLEKGTPEWTEFIDAVVQEMGMVLAMNGAEAKTAELYCGRGDLMLTCDSPSRNYEFGQMSRKIQGYVTKKTVEGLAALRRIRAGEIVVPEDAKFLRQLMEIMER